jgi:hyperosmotically inducible periplasmic protein
VKILLALLIGIGIGAAVFYFFGSEQGRSQLRSTANQLDTTTKPARDALYDKLQVLDLRSEDIKDELAETGKVVRRKAREAGAAIDHATADARITGAIKAKLLASRDLSSLQISVNTTGGVVTLSGPVSSTEQISKAMLVAMETDGVREVISTLQVRSKSATNPTNTVPVTRKATKTQP